MLKRLIFVLCVLAGIAFGGFAQAPGAPVLLASQPALAGRDAAGRSPVSEKQKAIDADTEKLVAMAAELKVSVDKSNKNELSLDVIRKAEAVEKLAKSLKERIREAH